MDNVIGSTITCNTFASGTQAAADGGTTTGVDFALQTAQDPVLGAIAAAQGAEPKADGELAGADAARRWLAVTPLCAQAFAPFGEVIEFSGASEGIDQATPRVINEGFALRCDSLARLALSAEGGQPRLSLFRAQPRELPLQLRRVERHRLGSQAFFPLQGQRYLVVVAPAGSAPGLAPDGAPDVEPDLAKLRCFLAAPNQGVNYRPGTWHHPLLALDTVGDFLVIDRQGPDEDCDEHSLLAAGLWLRG